MTRKASRNRVILVDENDRSLGSSDKMEAHRNGLLHRAFSVFIFDDEGRLLLQRRARDKYHSGGLWTNTVCSHPQPGENTADAARSRLREEMGMDAEVRKIFDFIYYAPLDQGLTEHEFDHVFIGQSAETPQPDPAEVEAYDYRHLHEVREDIRRHPERYTEWFKIIFDKSFPVLLREAGKMYKNRPLIFEPYFEEKIWSGNRLKTFFGKSVPGDNIGESWEISAIPGKESKVKDGFFKGFRLGELWDLLGEEYFGDAYGREFPLLVKYIDAGKDLSVQVHPPDALARKRHNSYGKNETWYILDAGKDSYLYIGFRPGTTPEAYLQALKEGRVEELLNKIPVRPGDWYYVPAGTVHAIGKDILLAEVQQSSDITYRIYDYNRLDKNGRPRPLHVEEALDAIDYEARPARVEGEKLETPYFKMQRMEPGDITVTLPHFGIVLFPEGEQLQINDTPLRRGETTLLFAGEPYRIRSSYPWFLVEPASGGTLGTS